MIDDLICNIEANGWRIKFIKCSKLQLLEFYLKFSLYGDPPKHTFIDVIEFVRLERFTYQGLKIKLIE